MISITGSGLTYFALGVRVFQDTGSVTQYAFILVFTVLPRLFIGPIGGVLTDRWNRRHVMIISDVGAGLATVAILVLSATNNLQIWHIYVATAVNSAFAAFQLPAYLAASTQLVPKDRIEQAAGMVQLGEATTIIAPLFAGFLLPVVGLNGILAIDFGTFLFALITLLLVRFPNVAATAAGSAARSGIVGEIIHAWRHLAAKPGLMALLGFFAVSNFLVGSVEVLVTPLILILADERTLGVILFAGGIGVLVGSIVMSVWAGPSRRMYTIFGAHVSVRVLDCGRRFYHMAAIAHNQRVFDIPVPTGDPRYQPGDFSEEDRTGLAGARLLATRRGRSGVFPRGATAGRSID